MSTKSLAVMLAVSGLIFLGSVFVVSFKKAEPLLGVTTLFPSGGGTGSTTLTGILKGNGLGPVGSVKIGSNLTWDGTTLSATDSTASSTLLIDNNTFTGNNKFTASTTFSSLLNLQNASSTLITANTIYAANFVDTALVGNSCIGESSGVIGTSNCVSSIASAGGSLTISSPTGNVDASLNMANSNAWTARQTFNQASTTDLSASNSLFLNFAGGLVYSGASKQLLTLATSSGTVSSPLTGNFICVGTGCTLGIQNASASQGGAIQITDFNRIYAATSTFTAPLVYTAATNAVTCTTATASVPGCLAAADFTIFSAKLASSSIQSSAMLASLLSDETGTAGFAVFSISPTFTGKITAAAASTTDLTTSNSLHLTQLTANQLIMTDLNKKVVSVASSTLFGTGTAGQVLMWSGVTGTPVWAATSSVAAGSASSTLLTDNNTWSTGMNRFTAGLITLASTTIGIPTATTTLLGNVMVGNAALSGNIIGSTTPFQVSGSYPYFMQAVIWNTNSGTRASTNLVFNNNLSTIANNNYFANIGINSSAYSDPLFTVGRPNDMFLISSDGGINFELASTTASNATASFRWTTGGTLSSNIRMEMFNGGQLMIATTTLDIKMGVGLNIATSTTLTGQLGHYIASTTDPTGTVVIDWNNGDTQRVIATTSKFIVMNSTSSHPLDGGRYVLKLCQDATGGRAFTFSSIALRWGSGTTSIPTTANTCSMIGAIYDATYSIYNVVASSTGMRIN